MIQVSLIPVRRTCPTVGGRRHTLRTESLPSDRRKRKRRVRRGKSVEWLRAYLVAILNKSYKGIWTEIDLVKVFNARGYSLSWGRELWRRLKRDPHFNRLVKYRYVQKRLPRNGCFVILVALRRKLRWDEEPLFEHRDGSVRHLRAELRAPDLDRRDCLVQCGSHIKVFSTLQSADQNNVARDENQSTGPSPDNPSAKINASDGRQADFHEHSRIASELTTSAPMILSLNNWQENQLMTVKGRKRLGSKARWLLLRCRERYWDNCKVQWNGGHCWIFCITALRNGHDAMLILRAWDYGIHTAHAEQVDGFARIPSALCLAHARRWLGERTRGTQAGRVLMVYKSIPFRIKNR